MRIQGQEWKQAVTVVIGKLESYVKDRKEEGHLSRFSFFCPRKCGQNKINAAEKIIELLNHCIDDKKNLPEHLNEDELAACNEGSLAG